MAANGATDPDAPLRVGDDANNQSWRAFTSFTVTVPAGGVLESAVLRIHLGEIVGDPFGELSLLFAERIDMGPTFDSADFAAPALASSIGLSSLPIGQHDLDVRPLVQDALNRGLTRVDIRLRFGVSVVPDAVASHLHFTSFDVPIGPPSLPPTLVLNWETPPEAP